MALLANNFNRGVGIVLDNTKLVAASAGGDSFDRYAGELIVQNGDTNPHTVTVSYGGGPDYTASVTVAAGKTVAIGLSQGRRSGSPDLGGTITYDAVTSVLVGVVTSGD